MPEASLKTYPAPEGAKLSGDYKVKVNGAPVDVYRGEIYDQTMSPPFGGPYSFAYFDFSGDVEVEVESTRQWLRDVVIRPESKGIRPAQVYRGSMKFNISDAPCHISIEPDGKHGPLLLFANDIKEKIPSADETGVKYFGPGMHQVGKIELTDNETLYIAGGAVVKGGVHANGKNIQILGRGILDGLEYPWFQGPTHTIIDLDHCENVLIDGIVIKDGWGWNLNMRGCKDVTVRNLKLVALRCMNNDGIDICNTRDVLIEDSFIRSEDDCIAIKGFGFAERQAVDNILVRRTSLWNDRAHVWRIGCECRAEAMRNITFKDIDVLHYVTNYWNGDDLPTCVSLQPAEDMTLENVLFEDIRINHEGQEWVFEIMPKVTQWAEKKTPGRIRNCTFRNVNLYGELRGGNFGKIKVHGPDPEHSVETIIFENVVRHGEPTGKNSPSVEVSGHARDIVFK